MPKVNVSYKSKKRAEKESKPKLLKKNNAKRLQSKFTPWSE